jgi:ABC-type glutathione transport system ATPase component
LLHFDYDAVPSRDRTLALDDCQSILRSGDTTEAQELWRCLTEIADEKRPAGGTTDLQQLLAELRGQFDLREHPDYRRDWELSSDLSRDLMADVRTQIPDIPPLARASDRASIENCLNEQRACLLVGESGCGKSALAKEIARFRYPRAIWIAANTLDHDTAAQFERDLGLSHPFVEILTSLPEPCLLIFRRS